MRILFIDYNIPYLINDREHIIGGASIQAYNWMLGLIANEVEVGCLVENSKGIEISTNIRLLNGFQLDKGIYPLNWFTYRRRVIEKIIDEFKPDWIYQAGAGFLTWVLVLIAKKKNVKFIHRIANDADLDQRIKARLNILTQKLYLYSLSKVDLISCQNSYQHEKLLKIVESNKLIKLYNPIKIETKIIDVFNEIKREYVAWVGIFQYQKNLSALFQIVKELPNIEFRIAGAPKKYLDLETKEALKALKKCRNVKFVGYIKRKDIFNFLSEATLLLNTSHYEGFSNTFLESFKAGTPVVTLKKTDPDGIIEMHGLGLAVTDYDSIPGAIKNLLNSSDLKIISKKCRDYLIINHDAEKLAKNLVFALGKLQ